MILDLTWISPTEIISCTKNGELFQMDILSNTVITHYQSNTVEDISIVIKLKTEEIFATGDEDGRINIFEVNNSTPIKTFMHDSSITCMEWGKFNSQYLARYIYLCKD